MSYRLTTFVLAGGYVGVVAISLIYVSTWDRDGFAIAKYQEWCLVGLVAGAFAGAMAELALGIFQRRGHRFSIKEFMIAIAIMAAAICTCGALAKRAMTPDKKVSNAGVEYKAHPGHTRHR